MSCEQFPGEVVLRLGGHDKSSDPAASFSVKVDYLKILEGQPADPLVRPENQTSHQPAIDLGYGVTTRIEPDRMTLVHDLKVVDWDGISENGASHTLTVTFPDGTNKNITDRYRQREKSAWYWLSEEFGSISEVQAGTYTYQVTDAAGNVSVSVTDELDPHTLPLLAEDEISFSQNGNMTTISWAGLENYSYYDINIYDNARHRVYRDWTPNSSYIIPPGALEPNTEYQVQIRASDDHLWMDWDNHIRTNRISFNTGPDAHQPYTHLLTWQGVKTWTSPRRGPHLSPWLEVFDAQGVPENIESVTMIFPDGTERPLFFDNAYNSYTGEYGTVYFGDMPDGTYAFVVEDKDGHVYQASEDFTADPLPAMDPDSLQPVQNAVITEDTFDISWAEVDGARMYYVRIYDQEGHTVLRERVEHSVTQFTLPSALFEPGKGHTYRVRAMDGFYEKQYQNVSAPDWSIFNRSFTIAPITEGSHAPEFDLDNWGVTQAQIQNLTGPGSVFVLEFWVKVTDQDGVPENIKSVTVNHPEFGEKVLYLNRTSSETEGYYYQQQLFADAAEIPEGDFTFEVVDHDGNRDTLVDSLSVTEVGMPGNLYPQEGSLVGLQPSFTWDSAANASWYKVRLYEDRFSHLFWSPRLSTTMYNLPEEHALTPGEIYQYRVYAYHEDPDAGDIDNLAITMNQPGMMPYFWTKAIQDNDEDGVADTEDAFPTDPAASEDSDGDGYPDGWNAGYSQSDSTSDPKLSLDGFPNDQYLHVDLNADGRIGLPEGIHVLKGLCFNPSSSGFSLDALIHCLQVLCNLHVSDSTSLPLQADGFSVHPPQQYFVELYVQDTEKLADSIEVIGPGIEGSQYLEYNVYDHRPGEWWSRPNVLFGDEPPELPLRYVFSIQANGKTYTRDLTIDSYVHELTTDLSPSGTASGEIMFSWEKISDPDIVYQVQLSDNQGQRVWDSPSTTNSSIAYTGPELIPGTTYSYSIAGTDSHGNSFLAPETFVYVAE